MAKFQVNQSKTNEDTSCEANGLQDHYIELHGNSQLLNPFL